MGHLAHCERKKKISRGLRITTAVNPIQRHRVSHRRTGDYGKPETMDATDTLNEHPTEHVADWARMNTKSCNDDIPPTRKDTESSDEEIPPHNVLGT